MAPLALWAIVPLLAALAQSSWVPRNSEPRWQMDLAPRVSNTSNQWPYGPFMTKGRDIVNSRGDILSWAGINWPMSGETMIPEGLEWKSVDEILDDVQSVGWNVLRMLRGYATQMIDEIYERDGNDVSLEVAMIMGLGYENGTKVTNEIVSKNPGWTAQTTRFEIWSDIADKALEKGIFIHPDVHVHQAKWCCSHTDGNAWFDDVHFNTSNWRRGLAYVADWAKQHPNVVSMSLRNELRSSWNRTDLYYNWQTLVGNMSAGSDAIHEANPDLLISWSGMQYDEDLSALTAHKNILTAPCYKCDAIRDAHRQDPVYFDLDSYPWADKVFWELHIYPMSEDVDTGTCEAVEAALYRAGFHALGMEPPSGCAQNLTGGDCPPPQRLTPVMLTEFGHAQDATLYDDVLQNCLVEYTKKHRVGWMVWSLAGSYRTREGVQGLGDTWGLTNFEWDGWNDAETVENYWKPWVKAMNATTRS
ncbi:Glycosyl hydrolase 5 family protein [Apiospora saccharicola]|uniref:Glycosyl hydrolase 5 family protein n=1 Tax=Apiospora saccharicola TaxID=335842 RepID=A0ABR1W1I3_9PEZI